MSSSSSAGSDYQITDSASPDLSANTVLPAQPLRYIPVPDRDIPIRKNTMTWPPPLSNFVLNQVSGLVNEGTTGVKFFRNRDLQAIAHSVEEYSGVKVSITQVYNLLRHWRARWVLVSRLKMAEGADWDETTATIKMDNEAYYAHIKMHRNGVELINKPIENYAQMKKIYAGRVPDASVTQAAVHRALSHLMDHKAQANTYLAMTPAGRMAWFNAFLKKYYL